MFDIRLACVASLLLAQTNAHKLSTSNGLLRNYGKENSNQQKIVLEELSHESAAVDRSMLPMTKEKLALVVHAMDRNSEIYYSPDPEGVEVHDFHDGIDRMYTEEYGDDYCMVTWMGTNTAEGDWAQNMNMNPMSIGDADCVVHEGFWQAYSGSGNGYSEDFVPALEDFIKSCCANGKQLVLTGHSQGAAAAGIANTIWAEHKPITILFGNAAWIKDGLASCAPHPNEIWRFINSENGDGRIVYDSVPNISKIPGYEGFDEVSAGGYIVLPPGDDKGNMIPLTNSVATYGPENPEMDISFLNVDIADGSGTRTGSAHQNTNYRKKVHDLYDEVADGGVLDTTGFVDGSMCHESEECHSGRCEMETNFSSVLRCIL